MLFHELNRANCKTYFLGCESTRQAALIDPVREQDDSVRFPPLSQLSQMAQLTPREIHAQIASPKPPLLVDVRQADEYSGELGHVPGSRSISLRELARRAEEIADHKTKDVVCICRAGMRSTTAAAVLRGLGFEHVWNMKGVRALITEPGPDQEREQGELLVRGVAWSGAAPIARVEVSVGAGPWEGARLLGERQRHSWQWWELSTRVTRPGRTSLRARATDLAGRTQPEQPAWNRLGYGGNAVQEVSVCVR